MNTLETIGKLEAICLIITIMLNNIIFNIPNIILQTVGTSSLINAMFIAILAIFYSIIISRIFKYFPNSDILDISKFLGGNSVKNIIGLLYLMFFIGSTVFCISYFSNSLKLIYFKTTPLFLMIIIFIIPPIVLNKYSIKTISSVNLLFIPITLISFLILFFGLCKDFSWQNIFPIMGFGIKETFLYGATNIFAFSGIGYLLFINPILKDSKDFKSISLITIIISALYLLFSVFCLLLSYSFIIIDDELFSMYLISRRISLGNFIQRLDAIFLLIWIINTFCYCSFNIYFSLKIIKKISNSKALNGLLYLIAVFLFLCCLLFNDIASIKFFEKYIYKYFSFSLVFILSFIILILAKIKKGFKNYA